MREFLFNTDLKQLWEKISQQIVLLAEAVTSNLWTFLEPFYQNALNHPLAAGVILLALIGIPLIFINVKKSKPEAETDGHLDQLMEEMKDFEIKTPLVDLQKNFQDAPDKDPELFHGEDPTKMNFDMDQVTPNLDRVSEKLESDSMIELPSLISSEEPRKNQTSTLSEERETADGPLSDDSIEYQSQPDERSQEPEYLTEQDSDWSQISRPALSDQDDTDLTIEEIENLQKEMEESIQKLTLEISSEKEKEDSTREIEVDSVSQAPESMEPKLQDENLEETVSSPGPENLYQDAEPPTQPPEPEEDHLITHEEMFEGNFENHFQSTVAVPETSEKESLPVRSLPLKPVLNSHGMPNDTRIKSPGKNYKDLLESFILLKDQKR